MVEQILKVLFLGYSWGKYGWYYLKNKWTPAGVTSVSMFGVKHRVSTDQRLCESLIVSVCVQFSSICVRGDSLQ